MVTRLSLMQWPNRMSLRNRLIGPFRSELSVLANVPPPSRRARICFRHVAFSPPRRVVLRHEMKPLFWLDRKLAPAL